MRKERANTLKELKRNEQQRSNGLLMLIQLTKKYHRQILECVLRIQRWYRRRRNWVFFKNALKLERIRVREELKDKMMEMEKHMYLLNKEMEAKANQQEEKTNRDKIKEMQEEKDRQLA